MDKKASYQETEKLIAGALKQHFPDVPFTFERTDEELGFLEISWADGPTSNQVSDVTGDYSGKGIDIIHAATAGTEVGVYEASQQDKKFLIGADVAARRI